MNIKLLKKINKASKEMQGLIEKNGKGYKHKYFSTEDIMPHVLDMEEKYEFAHRPFYKNGEFMLIMFDTADDRESDEGIGYPLPFEVGDAGSPEKTVQLVGKMQTYYIRYLLIQIFSICECDLIEEQTPIDEPVPVKSKALLHEWNKKNPRMTPLSDEEIEEVHKWINGRGSINSPQIAIEHLFKECKIIEEDKFKLWEAYGIDVVPHSLGGVTI